MQISMIETGLVETSVEWHFVKQSYDVMFSVRDTQDAKTERSCWLA